jgi:site-specific DNA recombinase|tara:strand:+ start:142 stop:801 length:660 start_codon:yes stop_codon:yes gene_type:complete
MTKAIGYIRVSTEKQADHGVSIEAQTEKLKAYAMLYDIDLVDLVIEQGSAKCLQREGLQSALSRLEAGEAEALIVVKLDRLTRSVADLGKLVDTYFQNFALLSVGEQIDTRSAAGRLVLNVLASVSQWEREVIGERTSAAMQHMRNQNQYTGGKPPYGYDLVDGELIENENEQQVIKLVAKYKAAGLSYRKIAAVIDEAGHKSRTGKQLSAMSVSRMAA